MSSVIKIALGIALGGLLLVAGCFTCVGYFAAEGTMEGIRAEKRFEAEQSAFADSFDVQFDPLEVGRSNRVTLKGTVSNRSTRDAQTLYLTIDLVGADSVRAGRRTAQIYDVKAGESVRFSESTYLEDETPGVHAVVSEVSPFETD